MKDKSVPKKTSSSQLIAQNLSYRLKCSFILNIILNVTQKSRNNIRNHVVDQNDLLLN